MSDYRLHISVIDRQDPRLGRRVFHDSRSRAFAFRAPAGQTYGTVEHQRHVPILDQGDVGSCTGNAAVGHIGSGAFFAPVAEIRPGTPGAGFVGDEDDALTLYGRATTLDSIPGTYPGEDTGSDGLSVAKAAVAQGWISGYLHTFSFDDFAAAVQKQPVIVGTNWYDSMFTPNAIGRVSIPAGAQPQGGHEWLVRGYDATADEFLADNSWGVQWGRGGSFRVPTAVMRRLLTEDGDATLFVPLSAPAPTPQPVPIPPAPRNVNADMVIAGNAWERSVLSKVSVAGRFRVAFDAWKDANQF